MATFEKIKSEVEAFKKLQYAHANFGACDTEPNGVFRAVLQGAINYKDFDELIGKYGWQLYSSMTGVKAVERKLTTKAKKIHKMIVGSSDKTINEVHDYFGLDY